MTAAGVKPDAIDRFLVVAFDKAHSAFGIRLDQRQHVLGVNPAVRAPRLPRFACVVGVLVLLDPDARFWEEIHSVSVVPVHVRDDHIADVLRLEPKLGDRFGRFDEIFHLPLFEKLVAIESGVNEDACAV